MMDTTKSKCIIFQNKNTISKAEFIRVRNTYFPMFLKLPMLKSNSMLQALLGVHSNSWVKEPTKYSLL